MKSTEIKWNKGDTHSAIVYVSGMDNKPVETYRNCRSEKAAIKRCKQYGGGKVIDRDEKIVFEMPVSF